MGKIRIWPYDHAGSDDEKVYGKVEVSHDLSQEGFEFELDADIAVMREEMVSEYRRLAEIKVRRAS